MSEVTWQARRTDDSVLVDVTADVDGMALDAPTPNPLEAGGGGGGYTVDVFGPYSLAFDTPGANDFFNGGAKMTDLPANAIVIRAWAIPREYWNEAADGNRLFISVRSGNSQTVIAEYDWIPLVDDSDAGDPYFVEAAAITADGGADGFSATRVAITGANTDLYAYVTVTGPLTGGESLIYALVATPPA